ncbi:hypothetical protein SAMN05444920_12156 [Nonomuraea solani]|uniref:Uncharacterized protein n=1 Tax=Nonomuraea solani TaxID=1144553 RepID=A0A1H6EUX7_9ACTN|nr:DUF1348 family protein [Nonomuraea solani]SEH01608.1 hypothetical protein SAMN05444920_12156 [Nonomuraea solani]
MSRPPVPPFTEESARVKVQAAEDAWNTCDPDRVALAYTEDSVWRNDATGRWWRGYGDEQWEFDASGLTRRREASINDVAITESERRVFGPRSAEERGVDVLPLR